MLSRPPVNHCAHSGPRLSVQHLRGKARTTRRASRASSRPRSAPDFRGKTQKGFAVGEAQALHEAPDVGVFDEVARRLPDHPAREYGKAARRAVKTTGMPFGTSGPTIPPATSPRSARLQARQSRDACRAYGAGPSGSAAGEEEIRGAAGGEGSNWRQGSGCGVEPELADRPCGGIGDVDEGATRVRCHADRRRAGRDWSADLRENATAPDAEHRGSIRRPGRSRSGSCRPP